MTLERRVIVRTEPIGVNSRHLCHVLFRCQNQFVVDDVCRRVYGVGSSQHVSVMEEDLHLHPRP